MAKVNKSDIPFFSIIIRVLFFAAIGYAITIPFQTIRLSEIEKRSNPYKSKKTLLFKSNKSEIDSIKLNRISLTSLPPNLGEIFWKRNTEVLRVHNEIKNCYNCYLISYEKQNNTSDTNIYFEIFLNQKIYSHSTSFADLRKLKKNTIKINGVEYDDVKFIDRKFKKFHKQHIDRIYWSDTRGIVRIDVNKNYFWELIKY